MQGLARRVTKASATARYLLGAGGLREVYLLAVG